MVRLASVRIGVTLPISASDGPGRPPTWSQMRAFAVHAEGVGLDSLWVCDHLLSGPPSQPPEAIHECWTVVAALAASTHRIGLGQLVMCASFRNPGLLAKMAVTADGVSGGRLVLGLGAGWYDPEYLAFGFPTDHRVARFEEALQVIGPLLRGERLTFTGRYHQVRDAVLLPPPGRPIPVLVAAEGPRMLRLAARYADAWNTAWYGPPDQRLDQQLAAMCAAVEAEDRDPVTLHRTVGMDADVTEPDQPGGGSLAGPVDDLARTIDAYARLGIDDLIIRLEPSTPRALDRLARAIEIRSH
jgi:alkanesulfonate monooxygenase SsuD/methylene tetrahydromethanopterin reductase-like flavin-dependent oxidoreductase (luciferase family)